MGTIGTLLDGDFLIEREEKVVRLAFESGWRGESAA